jgi:PAS domain S-box-containing protein
MGSELLWKPMKRDIGLELNTELYQNAFDHAAIGMALVALDGRWIKVNRAWCDMVGYSEQELLSIQDVSITHEEDQKLGEDFVGRTRRGELSQFRLDKRYIHKSGGILWVQLNASAVQNQKGEVQCIFAQLQDITSLKRMEQQYRSLIAYNPAGICSLDRAGIITGVNPSMEAVTGFSEKELVGRSFRSLLMNPDSYPNLPTADKEEELHPSNMEMAVRDKLGRRVELGIKKVPIQIDGRSEGLYLIARDITPDKAAEKALLHIQQDFQEVVRQQQGMTFKFTKKDGKFIHTLCDGELMHRLGLRSEDVVGKDLSKILPLEQVDIKEQYYRRAWEGEEKVQYEGTLNGITYIASLRPIMRDGRVVEVIASCVDITDRKRAEELLRKSDRLAVAGQLAAGLAHEIRNPLTSLKGFLKLIQSKERNQSQFFELMRGELDRIHFIVSEFLVIAKPEAIKLECKKLSDILDDAVAAIKPEALVNQVDIQWTAHPALPIMECSEIQIKQMLLHLFQNAIEAMPGGGVLRIEAGYQSGHAVICIRDNGKGMSEERLKTLGEPFYTTKEKGTGLGLMVCFKIIEAHKGSISFRSKPNAGTEVEVMLPCTEQRDV